MTALYNLYLVNMITIKNTQSLGYRVLNNYMYDEVIDGKNSVKSRMS